MKELRKTGIRPLYLKGNRLYASKGLDILISDDFGQSFKKYAKFKVGIFARILAKIPIVARVGRLGFHFLEELPSGKLLAIVKGKILIKPQSSDKFQTIYEISRGSRPLNICIAPDETLYFGEYFSNNERVEVHIYASKPPYEQWKIVATFPKGEIRHVHRIFYDRWRMGFWILTGDYDHEAAIWFTQDNFKTINPIIRGSQLARAVAIIPTKDKILGATDTQLEQNYLYSLVEYNKKYTQKLNLPIKGPCFDLLKVGGLYLATSVIERSSINLTNYVCLYGSLNGEDWVEIKKFKKDWFPKSWQYFFQFSTLELVRGGDKDKFPYIFLFARGVKSYSSKLIRFKINELREEIIKKLSLSEKIKYENT